MVRFDEITEECLDVSKPYLSKYFNTGNLKTKFKQVAAEGLRSAYKPLLKSTKKVGHVSTGGESPVVMTLRDELKIKEDIYGGLILPEQDALTDDGEEEEEEEDETDDETCSDSEARTRKGPAGAGVGDLDEVPAAKEALRELAGLKEAMSGLQSKVSLLQRDNGALRTALCAHAGGTLPVDFLPEQLKVTSPTAAVSPKNRLHVAPLVAPLAKVGDEEDELRLAAPAPLEEAWQARPPPHPRLEAFASSERDAGLCSQGGLRLLDCYSCSSVDDKYLEVPGYVQVGSRVVPAFDFSGGKSAPISPIATTTAAASSFGGSRMLSEASPMPASPQTPLMSQRPPAREPPMSSDRWHQQQKLQRFGAWEEVETLAGRPRPPPLETSISSGFSPQLRSNRGNDEDSDDGEMPPEEDSDSEVPSPPLAPDHTWTPGIGQSWKAAPLDAIPARKPLVLPFPDVPLDLEERPGRPTAVFGGQAKPYSPATIFGGGR
eukprot:gb/GFBE01016714.1/.p1 GENE.gb/GFBE01016714.1/~~gb/GFBE01016714.1/.p1  ORF type:complete len:490 (+),score=88.12 gb/GFBE01016714.1/:1-1470(+)